MRAVLLQNTNDEFSVDIADIEESEMPDGDTLVAVEYSTINYKDGLAITNTSPIVRSWPMVPGVDFAGTVLNSESEDLKTGDRVVLNGWDVGEKY